MGPWEPAIVSSTATTATEIIEEDLHSLEIKLSSLKRDYDQYFLGTRPREPVQLRGEVNKLIARLSNTHIPNTAARFKFSSLCSRFQAFRRQWDETLRQIEDGSYERHRFKAKLRRGEGAAAGSRPARPAATERESAGDLYQSYVDARLACGESVKGLTREKLEKVVAEQRGKLGQQFGTDARFAFKVKVEGGKARLKATRVD